MGERIPTVPAQKPSQTDAEAAKQQNAADRDHAECGTLRAVDDAVHVSKRGESEKQAGQRRGRDQ